MSEDFIVQYNGPRNVEVKPATETAADVIVRGTYRKSLETIGWDVLKIETDSDFPDDQQAYAAGYFEGYATGFRIPDHVENITHFQPVTTEVKTSLQDSLEWLDTNLPSLSAQSDYWMQVSLLMTYFDGMHAGINAAGTPFSRYDLFQLGALADIQSIESAFSAQNANHVEWEKLNKAEFENWFHETTHCSALFKLTPDRQEIFFGHCTWIFWPWMARVFKHITLNYNNTSTRAKTLTLSSWAGAMSSMDDFYSTSAGLTLLETSISVLEPELWKEANVGHTPDKLLYWIRAMVANRMASDAESWVEVFSQNNGGTYNNEWYILDRNKFVPGAAPAHGLLTVVNQLPTMIRAQDMSNALGQGHVASYNVPAIKEVFDAAGYPKAVKAHGPETMSYTDCARALIFDRDQSKVKDIKSMKSMMQYNDYENDPLSQGHPMYAIASRGDKKAEGAYAFGAIDAKVSTVSLADQGTIYAFSGPTPQQGPFSFDTPGVNIGGHKGIPQTPDFKWQKFKDGL